MVGVACRDRLTEVNKEPSLWSPSSGVLRSQVMMMDHPRVLAADSLSPKDLSLARARLQLPKAGGGATDSLVAILLFFDSDSWV